MKNCAGLKQILIISFIFITIIPVIIISIISLQILITAMEKEISDKNQIIAESISGEVERFLDEPAGLIKQIAGVIENNLLISPDSTGKYLDTVLDSYPFFEGIKILDNQGRILYISPYNEDFIGIDFSSQPFFINKLKNNTHVWSSTYISMETGQPALTLSYPLKNGMIAGHLNLSYLQGLIDRVKPGTWYAVITDKDGTLIAHPDKSQVSQQMNLSNVFAVKMGLEDNQGTYFYEYMDIKFIGSAAIVSPTGWVVGVFQKFGDAFASVIKIKIVIFSGICIFFIIALILCLAIVKRITTPLSLLIDYSKNISQGNYNIFHMPLSYFEINELAENFRIMARAVQSREQELAYEKLFIDSALNSLTDTFFVFDPSNGKPIRWNKSFKMISGYTDKEISEMKAYDFYYNTEDLEKGAENLEINFITKAGEKIPSEYSASAIKNENNNSLYIICVGRDIRKRKKLEEQLKQAHKMEAIGTVAGGIAHDFNNILGIIVGNAELALDDVPQWNPACNNIEHIKAASLRAKKVIQQLLNFSRKNIQIRVPFIIQDIINESVKLLRSSIPHSINIEIEMPEEPIIIMADPSQIHEMLVHIFSNAFHAMEENGGILKIRLTQVELEQEKTNGYHIIKPGQYVKLEISDTGCGISYEIKNKIFDPYFTTKEVGKGAGMGLSIVHGIVKSNEGMISVYSEPGKGTSFIIFFPIIDEHNDIIGKGPSELPKGNEKILFVDDEEFLLDIGQQILNRLGYIVEIQTNPLEALKIFRLNPKEFSLIITDMTMPDLRGDQFVKEIKKICPEIPVILCTGFSNKMNKEQADKIGIARCIEKPLNQREMAVAIRDVLDKKARAGTKACPYNY
ncbi:Two component system sensor histidine kinase, PAS and double cache domains-containing [Desulfonema limicola]|uniref:histidine kinase n=1 Tax=Desulfonema limicola TaxID=45656 RepID=A0A975B6N1_9BACT|nr:cache domain-containing protein [Desulfonema limicola]QTA79788.1 Two component system sensor histidine kinase, PAS and double cache domains-containing [Desulfonema limicola]